jgi:hypothetical protein
MKAWVAGEAYTAGDRRRWEGADLVCTMDHFAGDAADHPWDPGWNWAAGKAACLWTPATREARTLALRAASAVAHQATGAEEQRLTVVVLAACGVT